METRDVAALTRMYERFTPVQGVALDRFFANVRDLRIRIEAVEIAVIGEEAVVSYTRTDDFIDASTDRPQHVSLRLTKTLHRVDGRWRFAGAR